MNNQATPIKSISHPLWGLSLAVLLVNDHALKGAGLLPSWVTGKLSDLAGYFLFPMLLATVLRARTRRGLLLSHLAAAGLLLLTELSPAFCDWLLAAFGHRLWPDPTDLVALVSIGLSWRLLAPVALRAETSRVVVERRSKVLVLLGALATVATSPRRPTTQTMPRWERSSEVYVANDRGQSLQVRLSAPRKDVQYDCETALSRPHELFPASAFSVVQHVTLGAGDSLPLSGYNFDQADGCNVIWIDAEGAPAALAVWRSGTYASGVDPSSAGAGIWIVDGKLSAADGLLKPTPPAEPATLPAACAESDPQSEPAWSQSLTSAGVQSLRQVLRGSDGCDVLVLVRGSLESRYTLCSEPVVFPFVPGDVLSFVPTADGSDGVVISGISAGKTVTLSLVRRATNLLGIAMEPVCAVAQRGCSAGSAMRVQVPTSLGLTIALARGEQQTRSSGSEQVTVHVRRAENVLLNDGRCDAAGSLGIVSSYITLSTR